MGSFGFTLLLLYLLLEPLLLLLLLLLMLLLLLLLLLLPDPGGPGRSNPWCRDKGAFRVGGVRKAPLPQGSHDPPVLAGPGPGRVGPPRRVHRGVDVGGLVPLT